MDSQLLSITLTIVSGITGAVVGGFATGALQRQRFQQELQLMKIEHKTEFMAETTARFFLSHKGYTDRSFAVLREAIGGFSDDELRQILVRAGAIRTIRKDNSEWWRLLSRHEEYIEKVRDNE